MTIWKFDIKKVYLSSEKLFSALFAKQMNLKRIKIFYVFSDILSSVTAWITFNLLVRYLGDQEKVFNGKLSDMNLLNNFTTLYIILFWLFLFYIIGFYKNPLRKSRLIELGQTIRITFTGILILFFVFLPDEGNQIYRDYLISFLIYFGLQFTLSYLPRIIISTSTLRKIHNGLIGFNTIIIGENELALDIYLRIKNEKISTGNIFQGYVTVHNSSYSHLAEQLPFLGKYEDLQSIIDKWKIDEVIIAIENSDHETFGKIISLLSDRDVIIKAIPSNIDILTGKVRFTTILGTPLINISNQLLPAWQANIKQIMDYSIATIAILFLSPVMLVLAIIIKTGSKGPVIYSQQRIGRYGKPFTIYKLRSMTADNEDGVPLLSGKNDQRITSIGRFMRRHRLDEIPNFYNVIKGEMSLVGPRPERQYFIDQIILKAPHYKKLQKIKPGITSWGQIKFGYASNISEMIERLDYDLLYLENMSLYVDLKIIIYTLGIIVKGKGM